MQPPRRGVGVAQGRFLRYRPRLGGCMGMNGTTRMFRRNRFMARIERLYEAWK
jgi:hypothetical protein